MSLAAEVLTHGLWASVWKLLRLRALISISAFRRAKTSRKIALVVVAVALLAFLLLAFLASWALLGFLRSPELTQAIGDVTPFLESVPVLIVGGTFLGILLTSFGVLLQALYLAGDMDFLLSAPVPIRAVFITKLLQAILPNFSLTCLLALPALYGLGASGHYTVLYYPLALIVLATLALAAAGLSSLLVMVVVRVFPARRVAEVIGFIGAVAILFFSQSDQLFHWSDMSAGQAAAAARLLMRFNTSWSPLAWAGRGLVEFGEGRWLTGAGFLFLTLGLGGVIFGVALTTAERLYYSGWASIRSSQRKKKPVHAARPVTIQPLTAIVLAERRIPAPIRAIVIKDYFVLRRDLRNLSQLITPLILGTVYAVMLIRSGGEPPPGRGEAPAWFMQAFRSFLEYGNIVIALFVGWTLIGRLGGIGFSQEGKNYWMLKTAPVSTVQLLTAKFTVAYLPALALGWGFLLVISLIQHASLSAWPFQVPVVALCFAAVAGINLAFGVAGANLGWDDPRRMTTGSTGCLAALASALYLPIGLALFLGPPLGLTLLGWPEYIGQLVGLVLGGVFSLACAILPLRLVRGRVPRLGEAL